MPELKIYISKNYALRKVMKVTQDPGNVIQIDKHRNKQLYFFSKDTAWQSELPVTKKVCGFKDIQIRVEGA